MTSGRGEPARCAQVDKWADRAKLNVAAGFTIPIFWRVVRTAPRDRDPEAVRRAVEVHFHELAIADARLSDHAYLAGDRLTMADVQMGHVLYRHYDLPIERPLYPALRRYYDALSSRPAFREHVMVSYDALRAL